MCAVLAWPGAALASGSVPIRIELEAPPGCASAEDFYAALRARSEQVRLGEAGERATEVVVKLEPGSDVLHGELRVIDEHGDTESRTVDGSSCEAVLEALSLTAALAFEAARERKQAEPPKPLPPEPDAVEHGHASGESGTPRWSFGVHAIVTRVLTAQTSLGAGVVGRVRWESPHGAARSPGASFGLSLVHATSEPLESSGSVSSGWTAAVLHGCPTWVGIGGVEVAPCVTASGGVLAVSGLDVENPRSVKRSWWSVGAQLTAEAALGERMTLDVAAGVSVPVVERTFVTSPSETVVSSTPRFSPLGSLGLSYKF